MSDIYKKIKKQNGEAFAQSLRNYHNGLLEIPGLENIVRHAGREAEPLLPYLMGLLSASDDAPQPAPQDPFALLDRAGYDAFYADTLEAQNSIKKYYQRGELLCTFNDAARYKNYHIVHAVKKDAAHIRREDFQGKEEREDAYGASVISIQMLKSGGFISIKNRYNHAVSSCDNTFNSNPDNIAKGLSTALRAHFNVDFSVSDNALPEGFVSLDGRIFKYQFEENNIYYGDRAWARNGVIHEVDRAAGDALFDGFLFDNKSKTLKKIDPGSRDSFADDFNRCYGGNRGLAVQGGNLMMNDHVLIRAENSRMTALSLPALTTMGYRCLYRADALTRLDAPALMTMGNECLYNANALTRLDVSALVTMGYRCLYKANALTRLDVPALTTMGYCCLYYADALTQLDAPALVTMGDSCFCEVRSLTQFAAPALKTIGACCLYKADALMQLGVPSLTVMGDSCLYKAPCLTQFDAPALEPVPSYLDRVYRPRKDKAEPSMLQLS